MQAAARHQDAGAGQRRHLARPAREEEHADQRQGDRQALRRLPGIEGGVAVFAALRKRVLAASARVQPPGDDRPRGREAEEHGDQSLEQVPGEGQLEHLADQHVLRVADQRRRGADVRRAREADEVGHRVDAAAQARVGEHRGDREADDVVAEHRRERRHREHHGREQRRRADAQRGDAQRHPGVEPAQPHLRREHHEGEEEDQRRQVDRQRRLLGRERAQAHQRDGAQKRDAGAVEPQERQRPEDHAQVHDRKNDRDERHMLFVVVMELMLW